MKKSTIIWIVVGVLLLTFCGVGCSKYNGMATGNQAVKKAWSDVEAQYQRRADLITNLVETVKGYAAHESQTLQAVTDARAKVGSINITADNLDEITEADLKKYVSAQNELTGAMKSLLAVSESYPDLKANENFARLQDELAGTENRVTDARKQYNKAAENFNNSIVTFPNNIFASFFGFKEKPYFSAAEGAEVAPKVSF